MNKYVKLLGLLAILGMLVSGCDNEAHVNKHIFSNPLQVADETYQLALTNSCDEYLAVSIDGRVMGKIQPEHLEVYRLQAGLHRVTVKSKTGQKATRMIELTEDQSMSTCEGGLRTHYPHPDLQ